MKTKFKLSKRFLSILLAVVMVVGMLPFSTLTASASNISTSTSTIQKGHYIYFGSSGQKWCVLDASATSTGGTGMFLWSVNSLGQVAPLSQNFSHSYDNDGFRTWCTNYYNNNFSSFEQSVMLATTKASENSVSYTNGSNYNRQAKGGALNGDHLFLLSVSEALSTSYFADDNSRNPSSPWFLRSNITLSTGDWYTYVSDSGKVADSYGASKSYNMNPGFNLDTSKILFVTAATEGKTTGLSAVSTSGSEWKLTLKDSNSFSSGASISKTTVCSGGSVTVTHKALSAISSDYTNVTAAIFSGDTMVYYGSVNTDKSATSSKITIPSDLAAGSYILKLYGEDWNGNKRTDIATGTPYSVSITVKTHTGGTATCVSGKICTNCGEEYTDKGSNHGTLNYSVSGNVITEKCTYNCGHSAEATLRATDSTYTGSDIKTAVIDYDDNWQGVKPTNITYSNNVNASTEGSPATAEITVEGHRLTKNFQIAQAGIAEENVVLTPESGAYTGTAYEPQVSVVWNGKTLKKGTDYTLSWDKTEYKNADTYTARVVGIGNFTGYVDKAFTVNAANLSDVKVEQVGTLTYNDGKALTPTVSASAVAVKDQPVTFTYSTEENGTYGDLPSFTNVGSYTVYYKASALNHKDKVGSFTVKVNEADVTYTAPAAKELTYNSEPQELVTERSAVGGVMWYALGTDASAAPADGWSASVPQAAEAGDYCVWYKVVGDSNHKDVAPTCIKVSVKKATYDMSFAKWNYTGAFKYDGKEHKVEVVGLPTGVTVGGYSGNTATVVGDYTAKVTLAYDADNYNAPSVADLNWKVENNWTPTEYTEKVKDVTAENVTPEDKTDLEKAKADLEKALEDYGDNYTDEEKKAIEDEIKRIDDALEVIENVENVEELIGKIPENITKNDEATIKAANDVYNALTDYENSLVDEDAKKALDDAKAALAEFNKPTDPNSPQLGDNSNLWLWFALLFVSGAGLFGITLNERKRRTANKR